MLRILTYHRVARLADTEYVDVRSVSATPQAFLGQMQHVARHYHAVSTPEVLEAIDKHRSLPRKAVLITFDDAYADFTEFAWPILKALQLPITMFVPTAYPDHPELPFWWDKLYQAFAATSQTELRESPVGPLRLADPEQRRRSLRMLQNFVGSAPCDEATKVVDSACRQLVGQADFGRGSVMSWKELRELARAGVTIGSHTRKHPILTRLEAPAIREEIRDSQMDLKREIGYALPIVCYPNGDHDPVVTGIAREEGIRLGFTTVVGGNNLGGTDPLRLRRTDITPRTSLGVFRLRLLQVGTCIDAWRCKRKKRAPAQNTPQNSAAVGSTEQPRWAI